MKKAKKKPVVNEWVKRLGALAARLGSWEAVAARLEVSMSSVYYWRMGLREPKRLAQSRIELVESELARPR